jgi:hypothetical protein
MGVLEESHDVVAEPCEVFIAIRVDHFFFEAFAQMRFASQRNEGQKQYAFPN